MRWRLHAFEFTAASLLLGALASSADAAARYDPRLQFQTISTPHFVILFHQGEERLAQRLASVAEETHARLSPRLKAGTDTRTRVILVDQTDQANGWATPLPYNTIEIAASPPPADSILGNTSDWLEFVFTHEYAHILHLDRSRRWAAGLRRVFGRIPYAFPNVLLPQWQIEGLATYFESAITHEGRVETGEFGKMFDADVRTRPPRPIDRANGGLVDWPGGSAGYVYGAYFHDYLARRYGEDRLAVLAERNAGAIPYSSGAVYATTFGRRLQDLWRDFQVELTSMPPVSSFPTPRRLTQHGFVVAGPRWDPSAANRVLYSVRTPHGFPSVFQLSLDRGSPEQVMTRYLGDRLSVSRNGIYFDQLEYVRSTALQSDLYLFRRVRLPPDQPRVAGRGLIRLTRRARAFEPDVSPDGSTLAYLFAVPGGRALVTLPLDANGLATGAPAILLTQPDGELSAPRWSPDGRRIALERRALHGRSELILVDAADGAVHVLVASSNWRSVTPAWLPNGRTILFASDRAGQAFNLFAVDVEDGRQYRVTDVPGGASAPDVSADSLSIVYVGYTADGHDLFTIPLDRASWRSVAEDSSSSPVLNRQKVTERTAGLAQPAPLSSSVPAQATPAIVSVTEPYSPWATLAPRFWSPFFEYDDDRLKVGGFTAGADVLGRHSYGGSVLWGAQGARPDWSASYLYDRWRPSFFVSASDEAVRTSAGTLRDPTLEGGVWLTFRRVRRSQSLFASAKHERGLVGCGQDLEDCDSPALRPADRNSLRYGWMLNTSRNYGYSVSAQDGVTALVASEHVLPALGAEGRADALTGELRAFLTLGGPHTVLAARVAGGTSRGDATVRRVFELGGSGPRFPTLDFDDDALALMRGYHSRDIVGSHALLLNVDYRVPIVRVERGYGLFPVFLRWVHGSVFVDAGHAWESRFSWHDLKTSVGAELSVDTVLIYWVPMTVTVGGAWRHDGAGQLPGGAKAYFRIGRAF